MQDKNATTSNLRPNTASALCYIPFVGWIAAIVFVIVEKNETVRWNAIQALILMGLLAAVSWILGNMLFLAALAPLVFVAVMILQLVLAVKSFNGETIKLPTIGVWTDKLIKKM